MQKAEEKILIFKEVVSARSFAEKFNLPETRFIGQEDDGSILVAWDTAVEGDVPTTSVGLYLPGSHSYTTLYEHGERADIYAATVNHERTLLAFSVGDPSGRATYVAEIQPRGRVFNLNVDAATHLKAQFVHQDFSTLPPTEDKVPYATSRLLVAVVKEYVNLYQFKLQLVDDGAVLTNKPKGVTVVGKFDWYQWCPKKQWLYYARFDAAWTTLEQAAATQRGSFVFSCLSFATGAGRAIITISLPLPYPTHCYAPTATSSPSSSPSPSFFRSPFAHVAPVREINLQVLHRGDGLWCAGLQHGDGVGYPDPPSPDLGTNGGKGGLVDYSLYLVHSGHVLYGRVPVPPTSASSRLHFMLVGGFVAVYAPGLVLHLLNVGPNAEPMHHLAFDGPLSPFLPPRLPSSSSSWAEPGARETYFAPAVSHFNVVGDGAVLVECASQAVYLCHLNLRGLLELFKSTTPTSSSSSSRDLRASLIHLFIANVRHPSMTRAMVEHLCCNPSAINARAFAEYVVSSAHANVVLDCQRYVTKQLPSTASPACSNWTYRDQRDLAYAVQSVSPIPLFQKQLLVQSDQKWMSVSADALLKYEAGEDTLERLCFGVAVNHAGLKQVNVREAVALLPPEILAAVVSKVRHKKVVLDTRSVPFLRPDEDHRFRNIEQMRRVKQALYQAIAEPLLAKEDVRRVVKLYCSEMEKKSQELLSIIWDSIGMNCDNHPLLDSLHRSATAKERHLFEVLEAYRLAHVDLGIPTPCGYHTLFSCVGYLSLDPDKFVQCMNVQRMFTPTRRFVQRLAQHGSLRQESAAYEVICGLEEPLRQYAFHVWANRLVEQTDEV